MQTTTPVTFKEWANVAKHGYEPDHPNKDITVQEWLTELNRLDNGYDYTTEHFAGEFLNYILDTQPATIPVFIQEYSGYQLWALITEDDEVHAAVIGVNYDGDLPTMLKHIKQAFHHTYLVARWDMSNHLNCAAYERVGIYTYYPGGEFHRFAQGTHINDYNYAEQAEYYSVDAALSWLSPTELKDAASNISGRHEQFEEDGILYGYFSPARSHLLKWKTTVGAMDAAAKAARKYRQLPKPTQELIQKAPATLTGIIARLRPGKKQATKIRAALAANASKI